MQKTIIEKPDRTAEFKLAVAVRNITLSISKVISEKTKADYERKYAYMIRTGFLPEHAKTKRGFYAYRAAILYGAKNDATRAMRLRDKSTFQSDQWANAIQELRRAKEIFERYPPDPQRKHHETNISPFTWNTLTTSRKSETNRASRGGSKKKALPALRKIDNWRDVIVNEIAAHYHDAAAVIALTGARPSEVERGVSLRLATSDTGELHLYISIKGSKVTESTGQSERTLRVRTNCAIAQSLVARVRAQGGNELYVTAKANNLTAAMISAGRRAFPALSHTVTPYVMRHAFASDVKAAIGGNGSMTLAMMLGHRSTETQQYYGYARCGAGPCSVDAVKAASAVRAKHRNPRAKLASQTTIPIALSPSF